jgi:hypothetical protein
MSKTDEFWQYAKEAILSASFARSDDERQGLFDLARTWTQAALVNRACTILTISLNKAALAPFRPHP